MQAFFSGGARPSCEFTNVQSDHTPGARLQTGQGANVREDNLVGDDVSIGTNATILPGVTIGEGALVGAESVVARDVPPGAVVAGNPARVIKQVAGLTCPPGWFARPYAWPPYAEPESPEPG